MKILDTVGIDVSKLTLDVRIHKSGFYKRFKNTKKGFGELLAWAYKNSSFDKGNIMFVFEHTGLYSDQLSKFLSKREVAFCLVPGPEIKRPLGISRGKDDKVDAAKIALYGYRLRDEIEPYEMPAEVILSIKRLLALRERLVRQRAGFRTSLKEQERVLPKKDNKTLLDVQERTIKHLTGQIQALEKEMETLVKSDAKLDGQFKLVTGIKGVGRQTALYMLAYTHGFKKFDTWRKFASYCGGTAPFPNVSGISVKGRTKVSHLANKKIKSLLDQCAKTAIQHNPKMALYYKRRLEVGKNKMSTINVVRNKLLARIFAVVQRQKPYVDLMKYAA